MVATASYHDIMIVTETTSRQTTRRPLMCHLGY
jgi:hypothetical protein